MKMRNYKQQANAVKKYYNEKIKSVKTADSFWDSTKGLRVTNPTKQDRLREIKYWENKRESELSRLEVINDAPDLSYIEIRVDWKKNRTWGYNPTASVWVSGSYYNTGKASGCGYDKESASIESALSGSPSLQRFIIHNLGKLKNEYGVETRYGLAHLSIGGKGVSTLLSLFRRIKNWEITEMHGDTFDGYEIRKKN